MTWKKGRGRLGVFDPLPGTLTAKTDVTDLHPWAVGFGVWMNVLEYAIP